MLQSVGNIAHRSLSYHSAATALYNTVHGYKPYTKRLTTFHQPYTSIRKSHQLSSSRLQLLCPYSHLLVFDVECTCIDKRTATVEQTEKHIDEIIEIAVALYDVHNQRIENTFHHYIQCSQPVSQYCIDLTGISQTQLHKHGKPFIYVWYKLHEWFYMNHVIDLSSFQSVARQCGITNDNTDLSSNGDQAVALLNTSIVTIGSTDLQQFIPNQLAHCGMKEPLHDVFNKYIDIALLHKKHQAKNKNKRHNSHYSVGMNAMLATYNVERVGNAHSAMDDVHTTCNLVTAMLHDNVVFTYTAIDGRQVVQ